MIHNHFARLRYTAIPVFLTVFFALSSELCAEQAGSSPLKIFILVGQSNMVGQGEISPQSKPGTLEYLVANDPKAEYQHLVDGSGDWVVRDDVWIQERFASRGGLTAGYGGDTAAGLTDLIGPELGFGHAVGDLYEEQVLIIKAAWGGKSLGLDFLPPSSGPYPTPTESGDPGYFYQQVLEAVSAVTDNLTTYFPDYDGGGYEIAGFCWHQGWNDRIDSGFSNAYETNMVNFINDMRTDLGAPNLPFVIASAAQDPWITYTKVEKAQLKMADVAAYPAFAGNVAAIDTRASYDGLSFWQLAENSPADQGYHWNRNAKSYLNIGKAMADAMSLMVKPRCPYRLKANGDGSGVNLSWENGSDALTSVGVNRHGTTIAAAVSTGTSSFLDTTAQPGVIEYELIFTKSGTPCPPLTLTFDAGITDLEAYRTQTSVKLRWVNNLGYTGIEIRRDGALISTLTGTETSFVDTAPPTSGTVSYSVVPTNGSATPTVTSINLDGPSPGNAYVYESFEDSDSSLYENHVGAGLVGRWIGGLHVASGSMSYGLLPTSGNQVYNNGSNTTTGALLRPELAEAGLLNDGAELWFSFLTNNTSSSNTAVVFSLGTDRSDYFDGIEDDGEGIGVNLHQGSSPQAATWTPNRSTGSSSSSIPNNTTRLVVGKITWGADEASADTIEVFLPGNDFSMPSTPVSSTSAVLDQSKFRVVSFGGKNAGSPKIDEIRFAASYADVIASDLMVADTTAPTPDPMTWSSAPSALGDSSITMTANTASDPSGVEYYFEETSGNPGGTNSEWQDSPTYTDTGLNPETTYSYTVTARDKSPDQNSTNASTPASPATTQAVDIIAPPTPSFETQPTAISHHSITMTAAAVTDPNGVEYYFTETSGHPGGSDSGWQDSTVYIDSGLDPLTTYSYTVMARDKASAANTSAPSPAESAVTDEAPPIPNGALIYEPFAQTGGSLSGVSGGEGLNSWNSNNNPSIAETPTITYGDLPTSGGQLNLPNTGGTDAWVTTKSTLGDYGLLNDGATLWFSYVFVKTSGDSSNEKGGFSFGTDRIDGAYNGTKMNNSGNGLGVITRTKSISAAGWLNGGNGSTGGSITIDYTTPILVVGKIEWGATTGDDETITIYTPAMDDLTSLDAGVTHSVSGFDQSLIDTISFTQRNSNGDQIYDEIRFGATYEAVIGAEAGGSDYDVWASIYAPADLEDPSADFDKDGVSNREELIWGLDPTNGNSANPISIPLDPTTGTMTYTRRPPSLTGITYTYEWTTTMAEDDWTAFTPSDESSDNGSFTEEVTITLPSALLNGNNLFIRVAAYEE
ncbi:hypothetical protein JO972_08780 [Verrucomicrobiaceae bacterium 5K15]|uniref:Fibronectin type-III domain-containing protein n=1 Tax=Oceaniferula flava TaxID=2800421 RepID=A0AAE2SEW3_9BACT|nr:sialate O-acetylesterase [Oceaniferula flavus]MBK1855051.1 hypothetical protein [Oceaniferula flavus]MBM1136357.1 hypothetical protein [Oceaniferula flavus]